MVALDAKTQSRPETEQAAARLCRHGGLHALAPVVTVSTALPALQLTAVIKSSQTSTPPPPCIHEHLGFTTRRIDTLSI